MARVQPREGTHRNAACGAAEAIHIAPGLIRVITPGGGAGKPQKKPESGLSLVARGYKRNQFRKAFARYLPPLPDVPTPDPTQPENDPPDPPSSNPTPIFDDFAVKTLQPEDFCGSQPDFEPLQEDPCNTPKKSENASVSADCNVVTAKMPEIRVGAERVPSDRAVFESVKEYVCYLSERHPTWSVDRIAREIGTRNVERVARYMPERSVMPADEAREMLDYWVRERWAIRERRLQGLPRDRLTDDPILHEFKFCNVRRSDDATTRWIIEHITRPFATDPTLLTMFTIARLINLPDTLAELIATPKAWPGNRFEPSVVQHVLRARLDRKVTTFSDAYGRGTLKNPINIAAIVAEVWRRRDEFRLGRLADVHKRLTAIRGLGGDGFLAYQIIIDARFSALLENAPDRDNWAAAGPGTLRGINRMVGRPIDQRMPQGEALEYMRGLFKELGNTFSNIELDFSDCPNILCETDKYIRARTNPGTRLRKFRPRV